MISRYTPFEIPRWRESEGLRRLLAAFERVLPLRKPSDLARREIVQFVLSASGGLAGEISTLLNNAAELSIRNRRSTEFCQSGNHVQQGSAESS